MGSLLFLGRYQAVRLLGEGGMGRVYLARATHRERLVVVKVVHEKYAADAHYREAFRREIDVLTRLRHPGSVQLYDSSMTDAHGPCLVMEYVEGESLDALLRRHGRLPPRRVGRLLGGLCAVLQAAHDQGIVHRDLKPANVMVLGAGTPTERVKVLDFGLAALALAPAQGPYLPLEKFTGARAHSAAGTPEYTCPEPFRGEDVGPAGDLYSVGVILYELLTGHLPFEGATVTDLVSAHAHQPPPPFAQWGRGTRLQAVTQGGIPPAVETVVQACLAKHPSDRPANARDLARRYGEALGQPIWNEEGPHAQPAQGGRGSAEPPTQARQEPRPPQPEPARVAPPRDDPRWIVWRLEAWMPERIAAVKLRGFLDSVGGEVVESTPGLIRVNLWWRRGTSQEPSSGVWSPLGFRKEPEPVSDRNRVLMEVHMERPAPDQTSRLALTVRLRPAGIIPRQVTADWRAWCDRLQADLGAYLMAPR